MDNLAIKRHEVVKLAGLHLNSLVTGKQLFEAARYAQDMGFLPDLIEVLTDGELAVGKRYQTHILRYGSEPKYMEMVSLSGLLDLDYERLIKNAGH